MANNILTMDAIKWQTMALLSNELSFSNKVSREYNDQFAKAGRKIGDSIRITIPDTFFSEEGGEITNFNNYNDRWVTLKIKQRHVPLKFSTKELLLDMDAFSDRVLKPAVKQLANDIDLDGLRLCAEVVANSVGDGKTNLDEDLILEASQMLNDNSTPTGDDRAFIVGTMANRTGIQSLGGFYNSARVISQNFESGKLSKDIYGFSFGLDQNVIKHTFGTGVSDTITVSASATEGAETISITGLTGNLNPGDFFHIEGLYMANPVNHMVTGTLKRFTVQKVVKGQSGAATIYLNEKLYADEESLYRNVTALPQSGDALVFAGTAGQIAEIGLAFHKSAVVMCVVDDNLPRKGADSHLATDPDLGLSLRITEQYNAEKDYTVSRIDVWYGFAVVRQEFIARVVTAARKIAA